MESFVWSTVLFVVVFAGIYAAHLMAPVGVREDTASCRPSDPQRGAAGTGVERDARGDLTGPAAALPRSPQSPAAAGAPRRPAAAGLHRKRVVLNG